MNETHSAPGERVDVAASQAASLLERAQGRLVAVIGDPILDRYVYGEPQRVAREAPVLILRWAGDEERAGGAANAAANASALGARVELVGLVGQDRAADRLEALMEQQGIAHTLVRDAGRPTTVKTRFVAGSRQTVWQQVLRLDRWEGGFANGEALARLVEAARLAASRADAVILSEYGAGTLAPPVRDAAMEAAKARGAPVVVDSRYRLLDFGGAFAATPNTGEAEHAVGRPLRVEQDFVEAGQKLLAKLDVRLLVLTRGEEGMSLFFRDGRRPLRLMAYRPREVYDVSGAGDTVISALALGLTVGEEHAVAAALLADVAAGLVVAKRGVATVSAGEVREALEAWAPEVYALPMPQEGR
ncbi:MAG: hypothetical protein IMX02_12650 [Limnochordaceae bacterium]|nr:hypothetical protein [Limnochordaceae bacterium]